MFPYTPPPKHPQLLALIERITLALFLLMLAVVAMAVVALAAKADVLPRQTTPARSIDVDGTTVYTFPGKIGEKVVVKLRGNDFEYTVGSVGSAAAAAEQRLGTVGDTIVVAGKTVYTFTKVGTFTIGLPGPDVIVNVTSATPTPPPPPATQPTPTPTTPSPPTPTPGSTTPAPGTTLIRVTSGSGGITLRSNTTYVSASGRATLHADTGVTVNDNTVNAWVIGIDFVGNGEKGDGIRMVAKRCNGIHFVDDSFRNFRAGITSQNLNIGPLSDYNRNLEIVRSRFLDMAGTGVKEGHGGFIMTVDGLRFEENLVDGAGFAKTSRNIFTHGIYDQHGNRNDVFVRNIFSRCESVGIQARGSLNRDSDPDDGTPGPVVNDNLIIDAAIGIMVNGPKAEVRRNIVQVGHYHTVAPRSGQGGVYASVGKLKETDNVRVNGPTGAPGTLGARIDPAFLNNPRPHKDTDVHTGQVVGWEWNRATGYAENSGNRDRLDVTPDFSDLVKRARAGERVGPLIDIARTRLPK